MAEAVGGRGGPICGRKAEQELLRRAIRSSVKGAPAAVLVRGEAGIGKTRLVSSVVDRAGVGGFAVLWARCLRLGSGTAPYLPLVTAFQGWLDRCGPVEARGLLDAVPDLDALLPAARRSQQLPPGRVLQVVDRALGHLTTVRPVVLVVDDLQWADAGSLDVLAYVVSDLDRRALTVLATCRDVGLSDGHPLHGWLADLVRMPGVVDLPLARLDEDETAEQVAALLGDVPRRSLVAQVWASTGGNPSLTELLVRDLPPSAVRLPPELPAALRTTLMAGWHTLSPEARRLTQVLAVAGRPVAPEVLGGVAGRPVPPAVPEPFVEALHEATAAGVVEVERSGGIWFRHPLLAEVLDSTLLPEEVAGLHRVFVDVLRGGGGSDAGTYGDLARHYAGAGLHDDAFRHYLLAGDRAVEVRAYPEAWALRRRAWGLWPRTSPGCRVRAGPPAALLAESARIAWLGGDPASAVEALEAAWPLVVPERDPVTASRVLRLRWQIAGTGGGPRAGLLAQLREAMRISAAVPDSEEHVLALADLSDAELWSGDRAAATERAGEALAAARRCGHRSARSYALAAVVHTRADHLEAEQWASEAVRLAGGARGPEYVGRARLALAQVLDRQGRYVEAADVLVRGLAGGAGSDSVTALLATVAATELLVVGRLEEAAAILRELLASRPDGVVGPAARETAAVVSLRTCRPGSAGPDVDRRPEPGRDLDEHPGLHGPALHAELLLAAGSVEEALDALERTVPRLAAADAAHGDELMVWAARAAAALPPEERRRGIERVLATRERASGRGSGEPTPCRTAAAALFEAELGRCLGSPDAVERWARAVPLLDRAGLRYDAADARRSLAEALLAQRRRREAVVPLRDAHAAAREMGAGRLEGEVEAVAHAARLPLDAAEEPEAVRPARGSDLTPREHEVLGHLMSGRTYSEIAEALFISEKTVSVHVSNLLRKTGTTSRVEAAAWGRSNGREPGG
ncbi:helix-turn-helix transcriptional regulator [Nocardioides mesophilus]|uniref:AAA family ATPase n=1 Tax=Nocardioides mesophilus TaxID=433659 RepID=A0A7G9R9J9_9ACTN|nr:LuxR family transcriptional regulator [Nocardioides mesophilus]QNN52274.1 AAA family ATPase [Nocardioides mesophilus]